MWKNFHPLYAAGGWFWLLLLGAEKYKKIYNLQYLIKPNRQKYSRNMQAGAGLGVGRIVGDQAFMRAADKLLWIAELIVEFCRWHFS